MRNEFRAAGPTHNRRLQVFHVISVSIEITCKRSIKTITRNQYESPMLSAAVTPGKATPVRHVVFIFELLSLPESSQKAVILSQTIASQKNLSARLPEERPITFHMKPLVKEYLENVQRIILRPQKIFHERYSKEKMIYRSK